MNEQKRIDECIVQLVGMWKTVNDKYKYGFSQIKFKDDKDDSANLYELSITTKKSNKIVFTGYYISSENGSCFINFLGKTYKILHIDNSINPHTMDLEDSKGNIIRYFG